MIASPGGALFIDTPGLRELQPWTDEQGVDQAFDELAPYTHACRFTDCTHEQEPGCAVLEAVASGQCQRNGWSTTANCAEAAFERSCDDLHAAAEHRRRTKHIHRALKAMYRDRDRS